MSQQYLRKLKLLVGASTGEGLDLSELKIRFTVKQWDLQTPNNAVIRVWNVADKTAEQIRKEYTRVVLQAGYEDGPFGTIFEGSIVQASRGRENATDTYLNIVAADGDEAYNFAMVMVSLAAGSTPTDQYNATVAAMVGHGVRAGFVPTTMPTNRSPRGKVMFGMARDQLRTLAEATETKWSIQDGMVQLIPLTGVIPGPVIEINSASGMVGIPEQTQDGIRVRTLINPEIKIGHAVRINNADVNRTQLAVDLQGSANNAFLPKIVYDGCYRVIVCEYSGENRGNDYYSDLTCISLDDGVTPGLLAKGYG